MVANLRCNELKEEALEKVKAPIQGLKDSCLQKYQSNFKDACDNILEQAIIHYNTYAVSYDKTVYDKIKGDLIDAILSNLYKCFEA
jgi:hypothetical protein